MMILVHLKNFFQSRNFIFFIVLVLSFVGLTSFQLSRKIDSVEKEAASSKTLWSRNSLFFVSPLEYRLLEEESALWPRLFSQRFPPVASKVHKIYAHTSKNAHKWSWDGFTVEQLRRWSLYVNIDHKKFLKRYLHGGDENFSPSTFDQAMKKGFGSDAAPCNLLYQERLFRLSQLWPQWKEQAYKALEKCETPQLVLLSLRVQSALLKSSKDDLHTLFSELAKHPVKMERSFADFYKRRMWNAVDYALNRL